jgi:hypothetical protein
MNGKPEIITYKIPGEKRFLKKELTVFIILSIVVSWPLILIVIGRMSPDFQPGNIEAVKNLFGSVPELYGFGPFISAIIVTLIYRGKSGTKELFKKVIEWRVPIRWYIWALILPVIPQWIGLFLWGELTRTEIILPSVTSFLSSWLQIVLISTVYYLTEELGWRGFMLPRLLSMDKWIKSSLILGIIWSIWHYPLWLTSNWASSGSLQVAVLMVTASTIFAISLSVLVTWIFKNTKGSILLAMLFHGSSQANLTKMYSAAGNLSLSGSSFISVVAVTMSVIALLLILISQSIVLKDKSTNIKTIIDVD